MPSRLKLGVRADLSDVGDFSVFTPFVVAPSWGEGISTEKSRFGKGNGLTTGAAAAVVIEAVAECGESPLDDGDILLPCRRLFDRSGVWHGSRGFQWPEPLCNPDGGRSRQSPNPIKQSATVAAPANERRFRRHRHRKH